MSKRHFECLKKSMDVLTFIALDFSSKFSEKKRNYKFCFLGKHFTIVYSVSQVCLHAIACYDEVVLIGDQYELFSDEADKDNAAKKVMGSLNSFATAVSAWLEFAFPSGIAEVSYFPGDGSKCSVKSSQEELLVSSRLFVCFQKNLLQTYFWYC